MDPNFQYSEGDLVSLLKQKDVQAFHHLYDKYAPALYSVILQIIRDEVRANLVVQKVFSGLWHNIYAFNPFQGRLFTWMLQTARTAALDELTSYSNQQGSELPSNRDEHLSERVILATYDHCGLKKVMDQLEEEQKILIELCYYKGLSNEEIAKRLEIPLIHIKTKMKTALTELRTLL